MLNDVTIAGFSEYTPTGAEVRNYVEVPTGQEMIKEYVHCLVI